MTESNDTARDTVLDRMAVITGTGLAAAGLGEVTDLVDTGRGECVPFDPDAHPLGRGMRHKDRASRLALWATERALRDAGLLTDGGPAAVLERAAVVVSSNFGNLDTVCEFTDIIHRETVTGLSPLRVPHMSSNVTACWVALEFGLRGPNITLCDGTVGGLDAVDWARKLLAVRRADVVIVVGVEPATAPVERLHGEHGAEPGFDGAVALVVEAGRTAIERGGRSRAAVRGYGRARDRETAIRQALRACPHPPGWWLAASGIGTPAIDLTARLGRCSGALGVLQCAAGVALIERGDTAPVVAVAGGADDTGHDAEGDRSGAAALVLSPRTGEAEGSPT
jgi:3-oxoacyl-[acyl-carrier-protein] synthase II